MPSPRRVAFPPESLLHATLDQAFYSDAFETDQVDTTLTAAGIARRAFAATPGWVEGLLALRDRIVSLFGLRTVGRLGVADGGASSAEPAVGDTFSIFRVMSVTNSELVLGIDDIHLDVRISYLKRFDGARASYVVSSWVKTHNALGRLYMLPVAPFHRLIVRLMMRGVTI